MSHKGFGNRFFRVSKLPDEIIMHGPYPKLADAHLGGVIVKQACNFPSVIELRKFKITVMKSNTHAF